MRNYYKIDKNQIDSDYLITVSRKGKLTLTLKLKAYSNRSGFKHTGTAWISDTVSNYGRADASIQYYNRTWERYRYESLIYSLIKKACKDAGIEEASKIFKSVSPYLERAIH